MSLISTTELPLSGAGAPAPRTYAAQAAEAFAPAAMIERSVALAPAALWPMAMIGLSSHVIGFWMGSARAVQAALSPASGAMAQPVVETRAAAELASAPSRVPSPKVRKPKPESPQAIEPQAPSLALAEPMPAAAAITPADLTIAAEVPPVETTLMAGPEASVAPDVEPLAAVDAGLAALTPGEIASVAIEAAPLPTDAPEPAAEQPASDALASELTADPAALAAAVAAIEPEDFVRPRRIEKPAEPDDLKMISGVGPKIEKQLHALGTYTFAQIAGWKAAEIAFVDDFLAFRGRIVRDRWLAQAAVLARGGPAEYARVFGKEPR